MDNFLQQLINGLTLGSIYGLIAIGYTMVFGIIGMVNFAHGDVFMLSAFIALIIFMILTQLLHLGSLPVVFVVVRLPVPFVEPFESTHELIPGPLAPSVQVNFGATTWLTA